MLIYVYTCEEWPSSSRISHTAWSDCLLHTNIIASVSKSLNLDFKDTCNIHMLLLCMPFLGNLAFPLTLNASLHHGSPLPSAEIAPRYSRHLIPVLSGLADILGQAHSNMNSWAPSYTPPAQTCFLVPFSTDGNSNLEAVRPEDLGASLTPLAAQAVENLPTVREAGMRKSPGGGRLGWEGRLEEGTHPTQVQEAGGEKVPWRRARQPTQVFLPGESQGQRSLTDCSPWGHRVGHDLVTEQQSWSRLVLIFFLLLLKDEIDIRS